MKIVINNSMTSASYMTLLCLPISIAVFYEALPLLKTKISRVKYQRPNTRENQVGRNGKINGSKSERI